MSENTAVKPNGKILFGVDYFHFMRNMEIPDNETKSDIKGDIVDAVIKLFLLQWGFSVEEIDYSNKLFWEKLNNNTLDDSLEPVLDRILSFIKDDREKQEKLLIEITCVGLMDNEVSDRERYFANYFQEKFDLKPSEYSALCTKGGDWHLAFEYLGEEYIEFNKKN